VVAEAREMRSSPVIVEELFQLVDAEKNEVPDEVEVEEADDESSASGSSSRRRRRKRVYTPYSGGGALTGAYIAYVISEVKLTHASMGAGETAFTSAKAAIVRMMKEHGCRAHDIVKVVDKMVLAVFYLTDEDLATRAAFARAKQQGRLRTTAW
jgi:hypothetical protein